MNILSQVVHFLAEEQFSRGPNFHYQINETECFKNNRACGVHQMISDDCLQRNVQGVSK